MCSPVRGGRPYTTEEDVAMADEKQAARDRRAERVAALEEERKGYVARGLDDRVAQVDEQIALARKAPPVGRTARRQQTT